MTGRFSLFIELKRRNVIRMAGLYLVAAWLLTQVAGTVLPMFDAPAWLPRSIVILLALGFVPALVFAWVFELTPQGLRRDAEVDAAESTAPQTGRRLDLAITALMACALVYFAFDKFVLAPRHEAARITATLQAARSEAGGTAASAHSILVLPLIDMSAGKDQEYLSDGLAEELLNLLARVPDLRVISRSTAFSFKGRNVDVPTIARQLGVANVLEGSVRKAGNQVRITVQLIDATHDTHLWSQTYDRPLDDIFAIEDEIAAAVVGQLKVKLLGAAPKATPTSPEAYALVLQARQQLRLASRESLESAVGLYRRALEIAPDYAEGWSGLADTYVVQGGRGMIPSDQAFRLARAACEQVLRLAPELAGVHAALGMIVLTFERDLPAAAAHLERAVALAPRDPEILRRAAHVASVLGRHELAIVLARRALVVDPANALDWQALARIQRNAGHSDDAIDSTRRALALSPTMAASHHYLTIALLLRARDGSDLEAARNEALAEPDESYHLIALALAEHALGAAAKSEEALREGIDKHAHDMAYNIAYVHAYRHDLDQAFAWIEKALEYRDTGLSELGVNPLFSPLYDDPRWSALLQRLGRTPKELAAIRFEPSVPVDAPL